MSQSPLSDAVVALQESLGGIPGVEQVIVGDGSTALWLMCSPHEAHGAILRAARERLDAAGLDPASVPIEIVLAANRRERRVRFDNTERTENANRSVSVRTRLEWDGELFVGEATGEKGDTIELRTTAEATLRAVEMVTGEPLNLRLVGVKHVRAFDGELVVVSIYGGPGRKTLLGVVLEGQDPYRATAVAVLMALNRLLGNYLATR